MAKFYVIARVATWNTHVVEVEAETPERAAEVVNDGNCGEIVDQTDNYEQGVQGIAGVYPKDEVDAVLASNDALSVMDLADGSVWGWEYPDANEEDAARLAALEIAPPVGCRVDGRLLGFAEAMRRAVVGLREGTLAPGSDVLKTLLRDTAYLEDR